MSVQFAVTVLQELFAVFAGGYARNTNERTKEIGIIIETALVGNRIQRIISEHLPPGKRDAPIENIVIDAAVGETGKLMGEIRLTDAEATGKITDL